MIDFSHLTPTQFEEFCYDILQSIGYTEMNWRKGTGLTGSPSDQGRDIECMYDFTGPSEIEPFFKTKWYVECKHRKNGITPKEIFGTIVNAAAGKNISCVLIICSYSLANSTKNWIEAYLENIKPAFRISYYENKHLETLLNDVRCQHIKEKYNLAITI